MATPFCGSSSTEQEQEWPVTLASPSFLEKRLPGQQKGPGLVWAVDV